MRLKELEAEFRRLVDDEVAAKFLWKPEEVRRYAQESIADAAERGEPIEDDTTPEVCKITVKADKAAYDLHPSVLRVVRAKLDSLQLPLELRDRHELDRHHPTWDSTSGTPWAAIDQTTKIRLVWIPKADDVLRLIVKRLPICEITDPEQEPEIHRRFHYRLLDGMLARAYMKRDTETYNPKKSAEHEAKFTVSFGERPSAETIRSRRERRIHVTRVSRTDV